MKPTYGYGDYARGGLETVEARARFISRTYNHLFGAIVAFAAIEYRPFRQRPGRGDRAGDGRRQLVASCSACSWGRAG